MGLAQGCDKGTSFYVKGPMNLSLNFPDLSTPAVMGILNLSPDSFYDGTRYWGQDSVVKKVKGMIAEGATIVDIGGASTRPGAREIGSDEEWERISKPLKAVRKEFPRICISIDTFHTQVAERSLDEGADMINDISGGTFDEMMPQLIGDRDVPYVIMHIQGRPGNMQDNPHYVDVVRDLKAFFRKQIALFKGAGATNLILDPGFGFGKTIEHNYTLMKNLEAFQDLGYPLLAGISRKSMINRVLGTKPEEALNGTTVLNTIALLNGASILRVHDVKEAVEAVKLVGSLKSVI